MPELRPSPLTKLPESLIQAKSAVPVTLPSRLALNTVLKNELSICGEWFYDRTFPLWAAGRVDGLVLLDGSKHSVDTLLVGKIATSRHPDVELQLVGAQLAPASTGEQNCYPLQRAVMETVVSEFCHQLGIPAARVLCVISNNQRQENRDSPCILLSRVTRSPISHQHIISAFSRDCATGTALLDFIGSQYFAHQPSLAAEQVYRELCATSLDTVAKWQAAGFYYDNLASGDLYISGQTAGFDNVGFIDTLGGDFTLLSGATASPAAFGRQPQQAIALCLALGRAMAPAFARKWSEDRTADILQEGYRQSFYREFSRKIGLAVNTDNRPLIDELLALVADSGSSYFGVLHQLTGAVKRRETVKAGREIPGLEDWLADYQLQVARVAASHQDSAESPPFNPEKPLQPQDIAAITAAMADGNRNALENFLESIQHHKPFSVLHWAS